MTITNETLLLGQTVSLITFITAIFVLYRILVKTKDAQIELLKLQLEERNNKVNELEKQSPDVLLEHVKKRAKTLEEQLTFQEHNNFLTTNELEILKQDLVAATERNEQYMVFNQTDNVTGLYNRDALKEAIELHTIKNAAQNLNKMAFVMFNIDHLKAINDKYGFVVGDQVLKGIGDKLKQCLDKVYRIGGDEFAMFLFFDEIDELDIRLRKIKSTINTTYSIEPSVKLDITVSAGIAVFTKENCEFDNLLMSSDEALKKAKHADSKGLFIRN